MAYRKHQKWLEKQRDGQIAVQNLRKQKEKEAAEQHEAGTSAEPNEARPLDSVIVDERNPTSNADRTKSDSDWPAEHNRQVLSHRLTRFCGRHFFAWTNVALTFFIALAAIAQVFIGKYQWDAIEDQNIDIKRQADQTDRVIDVMRLEQRPWLALETPQLIKPLTVGERIRPMIKIRNVGKTPAGLIHRFVEFRVVPQEKLNEPPGVLAEFQSGKDAIPPDVQVVVGPHDLLAITQEHLDAITTGKSWLVMYVRLEYEIIGVKGEPCITEAKYIYESQSGLLTQLGNLIMN